MNKIFRKCRDFGLMVRLNDLPITDSLDCVRSLKRANIPLCIVDTKNKDWVQLLNNIAFKEDLFIAAESVNSLEIAYEAAANGAQFFILSNSDVILMDQLKSMGFFFVPTIYNENDEKSCIDRGVECALYKCDIERKLPQIIEYENVTTPLTADQLFAIVNLPKNTQNYELWMKGLRKEQLGLNYSEITMNNEINSKQKEFIELFSIMHKCIITQGVNNSIIIDTNDIVRSVNDLKWDAVYFNPSNAIMLNGELKEIVLDKELNGFRLILRSR